MSVPASTTLSRAYLVVDGECHLKAGGAEEVTLRTGDFVYLPAGEAHLIGSPLDAPATSMHSIGRASVAGEQVPVRIGGRGRATRWIMISVECERHLAQPLLAALPQGTLVDLNRAAPLEVVSDALSLALSSSDAPFLGASATRSRLAEIVFIEALARFLRSVPRNGKGWVAGLNDRYVGRVL